MVLTFRIIKICAAVGSFDSLQFSQMRFKTFNYILLSILRRIRRILICAVPFFSDYVSSLPRADLFSYLKTINYCLAYRCFIYLVKINCVCYKLEPDVTWLYFEYKTLLIP
jgi:hypothetical protein